VKDDYLTCGVHHYYDADTVPPDGTAKGTITFLDPTAYPSCLWIGKRISIQEGSRIVGYATINKIFNSILESEDKFIEYSGNVYKYLGNGPKATGVDGGWRMATEIFFRCIDCGYLMNAGNPENDRCLCGKMNKDVDYGRFGSALEDDAIEVYQRADMSETIE